MESPVTGNLTSAETPNGHLVTAADIDEALAKIDYELKPYDIVLFHTVASAAYGQPNFIDVGIGFGREATLYLASKGIKLVGTDAWSWDLPVSIIRKIFEETGDPSVVWEGHKAGADVAYCHLEKLFNLDAIPALGFKIACSPTKLRAASAG